MHWQKAAILGVGLLGGSLGMALRRRGLAAEVVGLARRVATVEEAVAGGALDGGSTHLDEVLRGAELIVICTPLAQMEGLAASFLGRLAPGVLVTDVGSVKAAVVAAVEAPVHRAGGRFVGSHPMAGSERAGVSAAREDLFTGAVTVITPTSATAEASVEQVRHLWESVGSRVIVMPADHHDRLVGRTSHLPHLVAAALTRYVLDSAHPAEQSLLCATGFRDTTRVASGSPEIWRDIALANRQAILDALTGFEQAVAEARDVVASGDGAAIERFLASAKERRDRWGGNGLAAASE